MPFDVVGSGWQLLADRHDQHIPVGGIDRHLACRDQFSGLILQHHSREFRDHRFAERQSDLLGRGRAADPATGSVDCSSAWANAALVARIAAIRATAGGEITFDTCFSFNLLACADKLQVSEAERAVVNDRQARFAEQSNDIAEFDMAMAAKLCTRLLFWRIPCYPLILQNDGTICGSSVSLYGRSFSCLWW